MRLSFSRTKNACSYYIIDSYRDLDGKVKTKVIEKLGTEKYIKETYGVEDAEKWCRQYLETKRIEAEKQKQQRQRKISIDLFENLPKEEKSIVYNAGYLFIEKIYHEFGLELICKEIDAKYSHVKGFSLNKTLKALIFEKILNSTAEPIELIEPYKIRPQDLSRALELIDKHQDLIQERLFFYSNKAQQRNTDKLYYYSVNGLKEPNCDDDDEALQLGTLMTADGIPLCFRINDKDENYAPLSPLEKKLLKPFENTPIVEVNYSPISFTHPFTQFIQKGEFPFVFVQALIVCHKSIQKWGLEKEGWSYFDKHTGKIIDNFSLSSLNDKNHDEFYDVIFFKEHVELDGGETKRIIVTFSLKLRDQCREHKKNIQLDIHSEPLALNKIERLKFDGFCCYFTITPSEKVKAKEIVAMDIKIDEQECHYLSSNQSLGKSSFYKKDCKINSYFVLDFITLVLISGLERKLAVDSDSSYYEVIPQYSKDKLLKIIKEIELVSVANGQAYLPNYKNSEEISSLLKIFGMEQFGQQVILKDTLKALIKKIKENPLPSSEDTNTTMVF